jgi:hypothetical protein
VFGRGTCLTTERCVGKAGDANGGDREMKLGDLDVDTLVQALQEEKTEC